MPIFEYVCKECNHRFELLVRGDVVPACPACKGTGLDKQFSAFGVGATGGRCVVRSGRSYSRTR